MLNTLSRINYFSLAKHNDSYDYSTLYTSIPHDSLKHAMKCLILQAYKVQDNMFLVVRGNGKAIWSDVPSTKHSFSEDKLTSHVEYSAPRHQCPKVVKNYNFNNTCARKNIKGTIYSSLEDDYDDVFVDDV